MALKEFTRFDLPGNYRSEYPNNDYLPDLTPVNLKAIIDKINEIVVAVNKNEAEIPRTPQVVYRDTGALK